MAAWMWDEPGVATIEQQAPPRGEARSTQGRERGEEITHLRASDRGRRLGREGSSSTCRETKGRVENDSSSAL